MPGAKGKRANQKLKEDTVKVSDEKVNDEASVTDAPVGKGRAVARKGKVADSQKEGAIEDLKSKNGKGDDIDEDVSAVDKPAPKPKGRAKPGDKKTLEIQTMEDESNGDADDAEPPKKVSKKETDNAPEEMEHGETVKPKKGAKKEKALPKSAETDETEEVSIPKATQKRGAKAKADELVPARRGGDRAVKKIKEIVDEPEEKVPTKKGRSTKAKNGSEKVTKTEEKSLPAKDGAKKRGRTGKKATTEIDSDAGSETSDVAEKPHTVAIEHCKS